MTQRTRFKLWTALLALSALFLAAQVWGADNPCRPDPHSPDCVGTIHDPYRGWKGAPMHSAEETLRLLMEGVHICAVTDRGPCEFDRIEPASGLSEWVDMGKDSDNGRDFE
jgi:hypothetical protein